MGKYLPITFVFSIELFFAVAAIVGYEYLGSVNSSIYIFYNFSIFILVISLVLYKSIFSKIKYTRRQIGILFIPLIITIMYCIASIFSMTNSLGTLRFMYYILWGLPAILMGLYLTNKNQLIYMSKVLEIIMLIFSLAIIIISLSSLIKGNNVSIGGASYQGASYTAAFAYGINLYYLVYGNIHERFKMMQSVRYTMICMVLLLFQLLGVLISGGRGGMVLIIVYTVYIYSSVIKVTSIPQKLKNTMYFLVISIAITLILPKLLENPVFEGSFNRVFDYIADDGIDWSGTSGRDGVYENAIKLFLDSPIFGYGIFGMWKVLGAYPHNMILELLLQGGLILFFVFLIFLTYLFFKMNKMIKSDPRYRIISIIALYPIILLMFSGTYLNNSIFWFCITYIVGTELNKNEMGVIN